MNIYVGGVNGVGKSTILRRLTNLDNNIEVIHYSAAVMQHLGLQPGDYEGFHALSMEQCNQATAEVLESLIKRQTHNVRLIDGHFLAIREGTIASLAGPWVGDLNGIVLITANVEVSWCRLQIGDRWHDRRIFGPNATASEAKAQLKKYIDRTQQEYDRWTQQYNLDHFLIEHNDDDADRAAVKLLNFIKSLT